MKRLIFCFLPLLLACSDDEEIIVSPQQQLIIDTEIIDNYLTDNGIAAETDASGLRYVVNEPGDEDGLVPSSSSTVTVKYEGRLLSNQQVFDSNSDGLTFQLSRLILGWQIGIPLIQEGGNITLYIPSGLAYGPSGIGSIPGNAVLIFDIELVSVN